MQWDIDALDKLFTRSQFRRVEGTGQVFSKASHIIDAIINFKSKPVSFRNTWRVNKNF